MNATDFSRARAWREKNGWTREELSILTGYSASGIYWFERGMFPVAKGVLKPISESHWTRYTNVCAGVAARIQRNYHFDWE